MSRRSEWRRIGDGEYQRTDGRLFIRRSFLALTDKTWWVVSMARGTADCRIFDSLRKAKEWGQMSYNGGL